MEAKCSLCEFFNEKPHCHNCKVFNKTKEHPPKEIDCSLGELIEYINNNEDISEKYNVGDYKKIQLYTGETVKIILLDTDKDKLAEGAGNARATFGILELDGRFTMNSKDTNAGGWEDSEMRTARMERIYRLLPDVIRSNIKPVVKRTSIGNGNDTIVSTVDKCFLFSEVEIKGSTKYSYSGEGEQYEYFVPDENKRFSDCVWLRSPCRGSSRYFCVVYDDGGGRYHYACNSCGVAFGFCI